MGEEEKIVRITATESMRAQLGPNGHMEITSWAVCFFVNDEEHILDVLDEDWVDMDGEDLFYPIEEARKLWVTIASYPDTIVI